MNAGVAVFDFDATLIEGDSLWPFLVEVVGWPRALAAAATAVGTEIGRRLGRRAPAQDHKSAFKSDLIRATLAGVPLAQAEAAARRLAGRLRWLPAQVAALEAHHRAGRAVVVASGALACYLPLLVRQLPVAAVLATEVEVVDGVLTGRLASLNCVRAEKARRVAQYLAQHGPFGPSWGYGNHPSDLPMLALVDHPTVV